MKQGNLQHSNKWKYSVNGIEKEMNTKIFPVNVKQTSNKSKDEEIVYKFWYPLMRFERFNLKGRPHWTNACIWSSNSDHQIPPFRTFSPGWGCRHSWFASSCTNVVCGGTTALNQQVAQGSCSSAPWVIKCSHKWWVWWCWSHWRWCPLVNKCCNEIHNLQWILVLRPFAGIARTGVEGYTSRMQGRMGEGRHNLRFASLVHLFYRQIISNGFRNGRVRLRLVIISQGQELEHGWSGTWRRRQVDSLYLMGVIMKSGPLNEWVICFNDCHNHNFRSNVKSAPRWSPLCRCLYRSLLINVLVLSFLVLTVVVVW